MYHNKLLRLDVSKRAEWCRGSMSEIGTAKRVKSAKNGMRSLLVVGSYTAARSLHNHVLIAVGSTASRTM